VSALDAIHENAWRCRHCGAWNRPETEVELGTDRASACSATAIERDGYMGDGVSIRRVQLRNHDYAVCLDGRMVHLSEDVCNALWNTLKGVAGVHLATLEPQATTMLPSWNTLKCSELRRL
jgi:hypothetical protein